MADPYGLMSNSRHLRAALLTAFVVSIALFLLKLYAARQSFRKLKKMGMHSFLFGHLLFVKGVKETLPHDADTILTMTEICRRYFPEQGICYLDMWPLNDTLILVSSPALAQQATQTNPAIAAERPPAVGDYIRPIAGGPNLFDMPEKEWKPWRAVVNKSFGAAHVFALVPSIVDECLVFRDTLLEHARRGDIFALNPVARRLTLDFVGHLILNASLGAQKGYNVLADSMIDQVHSLRKNTAENNLLWYFDVARFLRQKRNSRRMDAYLHKALEERYREHCAAAAPADTALAGPGADNVAGTPKSKAVIDVLLQAYMTKQSSSSTSTSGPATAARLLPFEGPRRPNEPLDPAFRAAATHHLRFLVLGGSDSTSAAICYLLHLLTTNPTALARVRAEHDAVFGRDVSRLAAILVEDPRRLNALPYSDAAIKETLRLFAPATSIRRGAPGHAGALRSSPTERDNNGHDQHKTGIFTHDDDHHGGCGGNGSNEGIDGGNSTSAQHYPTGGAYVWTLQPALHRMPRFWGPRCDEFIPERWLPASFSTSSISHPAGTAATTAAAAPDEAVAAAPGENNDGAARSAWMPFGLGPRACPGKALALLELKIVLALVVREFDVVPAYAELDEAAEARGGKGDGGGQHAMPGAKGRVRTYRGERAYPTEISSMQPVDGYPCRVTLNRTYMGSNDGIGAESSIGVGA